MLQSRFLAKVKFLNEALQLIALSSWYRLKASSDLPGKVFDDFGRKFAFSCLLHRDWGRFLELFCNPVNNVRYFEFDFCYHSVSWSKIQSYLDVSSPRLFFLYLLKKYPHLESELINLDTRDLAETQQYLKFLTSPAKINLAAYDATQLPYADESFDIITSISVIEHIPNQGDSQAVRELWRVLKPGGKLLLTVPCLKNYYEEWRSTDSYNLGTVQNQEKLYFFQRFYDFKNLEDRIINIVGKEPSYRQYFGEKKMGIFDSYIQAWSEKGIWETVKDAYYITQNYQYFANLEETIGVSICGLVFEKE
ncbi:MAG: methyltransferase domain-containing protein [Jaaginema sp. PMC 1079.18]|nr:methyltransferase domain-containing protein [Jaaginema sp. PMC 1080.18]MEC4852978.1 methyltransferase domain-containing protein [Jaaginema sp. PMC 1079.18]MEC4867505.1 methyltransferase domain-containing protein [Jaaginema sp. PMC 1078.18]